MSRCKDAPIGFECPYRHNCPHLDPMSATWVLEVYQESFELRGQLHAMEQRYERRIAELQKTLLERDEKIAQLQLDHRKKFKAKIEPRPIGGKTRRRGIRPISVNLIDAVFDDGDCLPSDEQCRSMF